MISSKQDGQITVATYSFKINYQHVGFMENKQDLDFAYHLASYYWFIFLSYPCVNLNQVRVLKHSIFWFMHTETQRQLK